MVDERQGAAEAPGSSPARLLVAVLVVFAGALLIGLPHALSNLYLGNDTLGYVATARAWLAGQGFVDPILYSYYLGDVRAPAPAIAIRAPIFSLLLSPLLALGAGFWELTLLHHVFGAAVGAAMVVLASREVTLPSATAFGIAAAWSIDWMLMSTQLLTEVVSVALLLGLLAATPRALESRTGAVALGVFTVFAWLARPTLGVFPAIAAVALALHRGPRDALRSAPLWIYALSALLVQQGLAATLAASQGIAPFAHYGIMLETREIGDLARFQTVYEGPIAFLWANLDVFVAHLADNLRSLLKEAFASPIYSWVGWIGVPGVVHALVRARTHSFRRVLVAVAAVVFCALVATTSWGFDPLRYPLPGFLCAGLVGIASLEDAVRWLVARQRGSGAGERDRAIAGGLVLLAVGGALALHALPTAVADLVPVLRERPVPEPVLQKGERWSPLASRLCPQLDRDVLVASPRPWAFLYWCGNAGYLLPPDLHTRAVLDRYLDAMAPAFLVAERPRDRRLFAASPRLASRWQADGVELFEVIDPAVPLRPWRSPGPLSELAPSPWTR